MSSSIQFTHLRYALIEGGPYVARLIWGICSTTTILIRGLGEKTGFSLAKPATTNPYSFIDDSPIIPLLCTIPWEELCSSCVRSILVSIHVVLLPHTGWLCLPMHAIYKLFGSVWIDYSGSLISMYDIYLHLELSLICLLGIVFGLSVLIPSHCTRKTSV